MTIAAIATGPARGALGVLRISGEKALQILEARVRHVDGSSLPFAEKPRRLLFGRLLDEKGAMIDEVLGVYFPGPNSFTGEDSAEITLHGNPVLLRQALHSLLLIEGLRLAEPGEFTSRAFRSGRLDLTRAEAIAGLIEAKSEYELSAARKLLGGELVTALSRLRSELIGLKAESEAEIDFSTEDLTFESRGVRKNRVLQMIEKIESLQSRGRATGQVREGITVVLVGVPNAGKSSLLNRLLGYDRAIVSAAPGTTRDTLAEELQIAGMPVRLVDTAGIRETSDEAEEQGVRRARSEAESGTIVIHVVDAQKRESAPLDLADNVIHVLNKTDLVPDIAIPSGWVGVSSKTGAGLTELETLIRARILAAPEARDPLLLLDRHKYHLLKMSEALNRLLALWDGSAPDEIAALEIDETLDHAGRITGEISTEEILGRIFSVFCVGK